MHAGESDHPRACGANAKQAKEGDSLPGSSPRMRGKRTSCRYMSLRARIIPAHAGQTTLRRLHSVFLPDHPRACGANIQASWKSISRDGSSPRMRGKREAVSMSCLRRRIIPAHAGQTRNSRRWSRPCSDHPRACGANSLAVVPLMPRLGSSPRMRGKHEHDGVVGGRPRIIPAHAGQTDSGDQHRGAAPDHPRACGANLASAFRLASSAGSSPRMRGKLGRGQLLLGGGRIIPAHAGQTRRWPRRRP